MRERVALGRVDARIADKRVIEAAALIARLNQGVAFMNLQKVDEAKAAFDDTLKQEPKTPNAW